MMRNFFLFLPYNVLLHLLLPIYAVPAWRRHRRRGGTGRDFLRRLALPGLFRGGATGRLPASALWVHAVSVGEAAAARPLVAELRALGRPIFLTATTETGFRALGRFFPDLPVAFFPFDLPLAWHFFLRRTRPCAMVCLETELWPNLLRALERRSIPFILVNGRLSERSRRRYRRLRWFFRPLLVRQGWYGMRGEDEAAWLGEMGVPPGRLAVTGNLKYDQAISEAAAPFSPGPAVFAGPALVFASLHPGEEAAAVEVARRLLAARPEVNPVFVPRHPERSRLARRLPESGLSWRRLGREQVLRLAPGESLLVERFGVLGRLYARAAGVFVGGSLVPAGGQNMLEPAAAGCPLAFGPHTTDFSEEAGFLVARRAAERVGGIDELAGFFRRLLAGEPGCAAMGARAAAAVRERAGAAARCRRLVEEALARGESS